MRKPTKSPPPPPAADELELPPILPADWDWRDPDWDAVARRRLERFKVLRDDEAAQKLLIGLYAEDCISFINDWGWTSDPRNIEIDKPALIPFVLFPKQEDFIAWVYERWQGREGGLVEKSRDSGATWLAVAFAVWMWRFRPGAVIGFGSRKEEYVDQLGDPKSIFWKTRKFVAMLPKFLRPAGYEEKKHAFYMKLLNPETGAAIIGEAGNSIGRGARAQPLTAKILTPNGWTTMGALRVGDIVTGSDGEPSRVTGVYPQGVKQIFRVVFSDGSSTECCDDHLWQVTTPAMRKAAKRKAKNPRGAKSAVLPLREVRDRLETPTGERAYQIPVLSKPAQFAPQTLPLHPYLLGALLGDGAIGHTSITPGFSTADAEMIDLLESRLPQVCHMVSDGSPYGWRIADRRGHLGRGKRSPLKAALSDIGVAGLTSATKFIPDGYKLAMPEDRLELLRGLMDTDGWSTARRGNAMFVSTSRRLIEDVTFIVQSLGGTVRRTEVPGRVRSFPGGRSYLCRDAWQLTLCMPPGMNPFRLKRKADVYQERVKYRPSRSIVSVEPVGRHEAMCITVDAADRLYVTDDFVVTHNTSIYFVDEKAYLESQDSADSALSETTNCQIDISTPGETIGDGFYKKRMSGRVSVFTLHWKDDPRKGPEWYAKKVETLDPIIVAREIDINYEASVTNNLIPADLIDAARARGPADVSTQGPRRISVDVARYGHNRTVISLVKGRALIWQRVHKKMDTQDTAGLVKLEVEALGGIDKIGQIAVDDIGVGGGVTDTLRRWYPGKVAAVNASKGVDDGINWNLRAQMYGNLLAWLQDGASLPTDPELRVQLLSIKYRFRAGKRLIVSKKDTDSKDFAELAGGSPDQADSLAIAFAEPVAPEKPRPPKIDVPVPFDVGVGY